MPSSEAPSPERPLPDLSEPDTGPFWAATKQHRLTYQACGSCGETVFHPRRHNQAEVPRRGSQPGYVVAEIAHYAAPRARCEDHRLDQTLAGAQ